MCPGGSRNLIITGFMGSGKSRVGPMVARKLGRRFIDMDRVIEQRAGKSILRIFSEEGEPAFRAMESALVRELGEKAGDDPLVISTGGGTLVDTRNREIMSRVGTLVCLTVPIDEMMKRIQSNTDKSRPLLDTTDPVSSARILSSLSNLLDSRSRRSFLLMFNHLLPH